MVPDGYGIFYNPQKKQILFAVSTFKSHETNTAKFIMELFEAIHQMKNIFESYSPTAKL